MDSPTSPSSPTGPAAGPAPARSPQPATPDALPPGTRLDEYRIDRVLHSGGFSIVYLATDVALERVLAIEEYLPAPIAVRGEDLKVVLRSEMHAQAYERGLRAFTEEAELLARCDHPSLLRVYRGWQANGTAYRAMPYYAGTTLRQLREAMTEPPDEASMRALLDGLLGALEALHQAGGVHRGVSPDTIILGGDDRPVLLGFDAARRAIVGDRAQALMSLVEPMFVTREQIDQTPETQPGPWTDVYALAAVVRYCIDCRPATGARLEGVDESLTAVLRRISARFPGLRYSAAFIDALDWALATQPHDRPQSAADFRAALDGHRPLPAPRKSQPAAPLAAAQPAEPEEAPPVAPGGTAADADGMPPDVRAAIERALAAVDAADRHARGVMPALRPFDRPAAPARSPSPGGAPAASPQARPESGSREAHAPRGGRFRPGRAAAKMAPVTPAASKLRRAGSQPASPPAESPAGVAVPPVAPAASAPAPFASSAPAPFASSAPARFASSAPAPFASSGSAPFTSSLPPPVSIPPAPAPAADGPVPWRPDDLEPAFYADPEFASKYRPLAPPRPSALATVARFFAFAILLGALAAGGWKLNEMGAFDQTLLALSEMGIPIGKETASSERGSGDPPGSLAAGTGSSRADPTMEAAEAALARAEAVAAASARGQPLGAAGTAVPAAPASPAALDSTGGASRSAAPAAPPEAALPAPAAPAAPTTPTTPTAPAATTAGAAPAPSTAGTAPPETIAGVAPATPATSSSPPAGRMAGNGSPTAAPPTAVRREAAVPPPRLSEAERERREAVQRAEERDRQEAARRAAAVRAQRSGGSTAPPVETARADVADVEPTRVFSSPRAACEPRTEFALYRCMQNQCERTQWYQHPQCIRLRLRDEID
jgi:serine/threonine protein kinase